MRLPVAFAAALGMEVLLDRLRGALWGVYIGDALAMPVHWYYDTNQLKRDFGQISKYEAPKPRFPGSIMNLSNTGGGGRGSDKGSIIGDVICHGKKQFWMRNGAYHYHHGLRAGENTLEGQLVRLLVRSMISNGGTFSRDHYLDAYVSFMTTPGSHNDVYAGTCHRMFFANYVDGKPPKDCADNDGHNVDTIDGLVPIVPVILSRLGPDKAALKKDVRDCVWVNRASKPLEQYGEVFAGMLAEAIEESTEGGMADIPAICRRAGSRLRINVDRMLMQTREDPMTACYLDSAFPSMLYYAAKYGDNPEQALLRQTNAGGENVARGAILGAFLGAAKGMSAWPEHLINGLLDKEAIHREVERFVDLAASRHRAAASASGGGSPGRGGPRAEETGADGAL